MGRLLFLCMSSFLATAVCYWQLTAAADDRSNQEGNNNRIISEDVFDPKDGILSSKQLSPVGLRVSRQKRACSVGGGMSNQCITDSLDQQLRMRARLLNGMGPGKRHDAFETAGINEEEEAQHQNNDDEGLVRSPDDEIQLTGRELLLLRRIFNELKTKDVQKVKKACLFNLGGHCSTESAAFLADRWHYLDSPLSPGRKRFSKSVAVTGKLEDRADD